MEWPKELLEIFEDPLFDDVRPISKPITPDDRVNKKLEEVKAWIERYGREPERSGELKEKMMWAAMTALKKQNLM
jgi:hypothetical protein